MPERSAQRRQFWVILIIVFLGFLGISMPYLIFPALFLNPEYSILASGTGHVTASILLGITLAVYPLGQFIGSPILGALSDDYGRKELMSASLVLTAIATLVSGFAISRQYLWLLIFSRFIAGLMEGNIAIARGMAADLKLLKKHETFGKINAVTSIAYLIGPPIGGILTDRTLSEKLSTSTPFYLICVLFFIVAGLSMAVLEQSIVPTAKQLTFRQRINFIRRMRALFTNKQVKFLILASTLFTVAVDIFYEFSPVYLTLKWTFSPSSLAFYNILLCLGLTLGNGWLPSYVSNRTAKRWPILGAMFAFGVLLFGVVATDYKYLMMGLFFLAGITIGLTVTLITVKISDSVSDQIQGEVMGVQLSLRVLGDAVICLFGGILLIVSSKLILMFAAALSFLSLIYYRVKDGALRT